MIFLADMQMMVLFPGLRSGFASSSSSCCTEPRSRWRASYLRFTVLGDRGTDLDWLPEELRRQEREMDDPVPERRVRPLPEYGPGTVSTTYSAISISPLSSPAVRTSPAPSLLLANLFPCEQDRKTVP